MPVEVVKQMKIYIDGYELSCGSNRLDIVKKAEMLDKTDFCSSGRRRLAGLLDYNASIAGFHNSSQGLPGTTMGRNDPVGYRTVGMSSAVVSIVRGATRGGLAYFGRVAGAEYSAGGNIGELLGFTLALQGDDRLIRGKLLEAGAFSSQDQVNAPSKTTFHDLGTASTARGRFYAAMHLLKSTGGRTLNISIRLSSETNMGAATTMLKWTGQTATGGKAVWASTRMPSTKKRYAKVHFSTGSQTGTMEGSILAGIIKKLT